MEVDVAFFDDSENLKSDMVDGAIGELSPFHETCGYYAQKDYAFAAALLKEGLVDRTVLVERLAAVEDVEPSATDRVRRWLATFFEA
jgi:hypothetical protein